MGDVHIFVVARCCVRSSRNHSTRRTHSGSEYGDHRFADVRFFHSKYPRLLSSFVVDTSVAGGTVRTMPVRASASPRQKYLEDLLAYSL